MPGTTLFHKFQELYSAGPHRGLSDRACSGGVSELEASAEPALEESIVFYRERNGRPALKAYYTRDLRLLQAAA